MANPFQQRSRQRKLAYGVLILFLFTGSLLHRRFVLEPRAEALQLRETSRGEVELTGSALRLLLTGSRGLATTVLWDQANKMMMKHQWNELELVVKSITKLQPYFITPWMFQSWNLAFNVAVECDRPRDKYYYVSRGVELLAEGERRNQGSSGADAFNADNKKPRFPGHPDMRHFIGFMYQLKIGTSDEKTTMRCLLELSLIDPVKRDPKRFLTVNDRGQQDVKRPEFAAFCKDNPRLVRRLREHLGFDTPLKIVKFLADSKGVPSRFEEPKAGQTETPRRAPHAQFPILPPPLEESWPDVAKAELTRETADVFLVARTWYQYAQQPLPPANPDPGMFEQDYDKQKFRNVKQMASQIFRGYPARAQVYIAENLQGEGWFDDEGWAIRDWFGERGNPDAELLVGDQLKFHSGLAWGRGYEMYKKYGLETGLYLTPDEVVRLNQKAQKFRDFLKINGSEVGQLRSDQYQGEMAESFDAHTKLFWNVSYRSMTNFDAHFEQSRGEMSPVTVHARKRLYQADRYRKLLESIDQAISAYEEAWPLWIQACIENPRFSQVSNVQEDAYELLIQHMRLVQTQNRKTFQGVLKGMAVFSTWPFAPFDPLLTSEQNNKIMPVRTVRGVLDEVQFYDGPEAEKLKEFLQIVTYVPIRIGMPGALGFTMVPHPSQQSFLLSRSVFHGAPVPPNWRSLVDDLNVNSARERLGLK